MSISFRFGGASFAIILLAFIQVALLCCVIENHDMVEEAHSKQFRSWKLGEELRHSSDKLTRLARTFVVTGDSAYKDIYYRVLGLRDGTLSRPDGRKISLQDLFVEAGVTPEELGLLNQGLNNSDALVSTEVAAFQAIYGRFTEEIGGRSTNPEDYTRIGDPDQAFAIRIMHDEAYHDAKDMIMSPIGEFEAMIIDRTQAQIDTLQDKGLWLLLLSLINMLLLVTIVGANYWLVQRPVIASVNAVARDLRELADGDADLSHRVEVKGDDEIAALARSFNALINNLAELIGEVRTNAQRVVSGTNEMGGMLRGLEDQISRQTETTLTTTTSAREIAATSVELHSTVSNVTETANETNRVVGAGQDGLERIHDSMNELRTANEQIVERLSIINERTGQIGGVVGAINKVAEQTNLLSLNAAIEAEKAGEYGVGFSVVAREIRRLADDTAAATRDIEANVRDVQSAVAAGVMEMDKFRGQVDGSTQEIGEISDRLSKLIRNVRTLLPLLDSVREGVAGQDEGARQIHESMRRLGNDLQATKDALDQAVENRSDVEKVGRHLFALVERLNRAGS